MGIGQVFKDYSRSMVFAAIAIFLLFVFDNAVMELVGRVSNEESYSHAPMVFLTALYLIWLKRFEIGDSNPNAWPGVVIVLFAGLALMVGELSAIWTIVQYSLVILCFGLAWAMLGSQVRKISIPFLLILLVIPLPYMLSVMLSGKMQLLSSNIGVSIVRFMGMSVFQEGNVIDLGLYKLQVVEACSGLNYMFPLMTIGLLMAYIYKAPFYARALLFLSAIPISVMMNSFRIAMVAVFVNYYGNEAAEGFLHYFEGWVIFLSCIAILVLEVKLLNKLLGRNITLSESFDYLESKRPDVSTLANGKLNKAPIIASLLLILAASLSTFTVHHRAEIIPKREMFVMFPMKFGDWVGRSFEMPEAERKVLKLKDYLRASFIKGDETIDVYLGYTDSQRAGFVPHSPKACIPGGGWEITEAKAKTINLDSKTTITVTRMVIMKGTTKQIIYYWFHQRGRDLSNEFSMKFALLQDAIQINRTDGAIVRFGLLVTTTEQEADASITELIRLAYPSFSKFVPGR